MATYNGELVTPQTSIIEADKVPRDSEVVLEGQTTVPRVSVDSREGIVRRSTR